MIRYTAYIETVFGRHYLYMPLNPKDNNYGRVFWNESTVKDFNGLLLPELSLFTSFEQIRKYLKYAPPQNMSSLKNKKITICSVQFNEIEKWRGEINETN